MTQLLDPTGRPAPRVQSIPNEMDWVDDEVKAHFVGRQYPFGMPTQLQLIVTMRRLIDAITTAKKKTE